MSSKQAEASERGQDKASYAAKWVTVVQPYVPRYRVPLFDALEEQLAQRGLRLRVAHGTPIGKVRSRGDAAEASWSSVQRNIYLPGPGGSLKWRPAGTCPGQEVLRVVEASGSILSSTWQVLRGSRGGTPTAVWGHIDNYGGDPPAPIQHALSFQVEHASHVFAYTIRGTRRAIELGADPNRVTTLNNTVDLDPLRVQRASREARGTDPSEQPHAIFIGALEESKRIEWVLAASDRAHDQLAQFTVTIVGGGPMLENVRRWSAPRPWATVTGPMFGDDLNRLLLSADLLLNPGRVGLLATESLASGVPMVTTDYPMHAPEFDYLTHDVNCHVVSESADIAGFSRAVCDLLDDSDRLARLREGCLSSGASLSLDAMANAFVRGIDSVLTDRA